MTKNKITHDKPFTCDVCHKWFAARRLLKIHMFTHAISKPYMCSLCPSGFTTHDSITIHMWTYTGERPYKCDICPEAITFSSTLNRHKNMHYKPLWCVSQAIYCMHIFNAHMISRTINKPYTCSLCQAWFTTHDSLKICKRTHWWKSHSWVIFIQRHLLSPIVLADTVIHMINHSLVMCVTSSLLHAVVFKTHMFTHATTKPYTCSLCQAWFTTLGNLKIHMHTNVIFVQRRVIPLVVSTDTETCMINHTCIIFLDRR